MVLNNTLKIQIFREVKKINVSKRNFLVNKFILTATKTKKAMEFIIDLSIFKTVFEYAR